MYVPKYSRIVKIKEKSEEKLVVDITGDSFKSQNTNTLNNAIAGIFSKIALLNFGYSRISLDKIKEDEEEKVIVVVYLKKD